MNTHLRYHATSASCRCFTFSSSQGFLWFSCGTVGSGVTICFDQQFTGPKHGRCNGFWKCELTPCRSTLSWQSCGLSPSFMKAMGWPAKTAVKHFTIATRKCQGSPQAWLLWTKQWWLLWSWWFKFMLRLTFQSWTKVETIIIYCLVFSYPTIGCNNCEW